jgi:hypothetical protein
VTALLPGAQHREDRDQGDAGGLKGGSQALRGGKRALTRHRLQGSIRTHQRTVGDAMNFQLIPIRTDAARRFEKGVTAQSR